MIEVLRHGLVQGGRRVGHGSIAISKGQWRTDEERALDGLIEFCHAVKRGEYREEMASQEDDRQSDEVEGPGSGAGVSTDDRASGDVDSPEGNEGLETQQVEERIS
jgi:hypothetical protein